MSLCECRSQNKPNDDCRFILVRSIYGLLITVLVLFYAVEKGAAREKKGGCGGLGFHACGLIISVRERAREREFDAG